MHAASFEALARVFSDRLPQRSVLCREAASLVVGVSLVTAGRRLVAQEAPRSRVRRRLTQGTVVNAIYVSRI